jgi:NhaP-type Na+/H+ or K+/H+ antiporter
VYAFAGTVMSAIFIGCLTYAISQDESIWTMSFIDAMAMGSLISATDPGTHCSPLPGCVFARAYACRTRSLDSLLARCASLTFRPMFAAVSTISVFSKLGVNPMLYNLVFGESVVNDAVGIVLFSYALASFLLTSASFFLNRGALSPVQRVQ